MTRFGFLCLRKTLCVYTFNRHFTFKLESCLSSVVSRILNFIYIFEHFSSWCQRILYADFGFLISSPKASHVSLHHANDIKGLVVDIIIEFGIQVNQFYFHTNSILRFWFLSNNILNAWYKVSNNCKLVFVWYFTL